jgi:hypothetical protein
MTSTFTERTSATTCVVCGLDASQSDGSHGEWLHVFHYDPPENSHACGNWIHENCRYRDDAPKCPCDEGLAEEGLTRAAIDTLNPPETSDDSDFDVDHDEAVPSLEEQAAWERIEALRINEVLGQQGDEEEEEDDEGPVSDGD